MNIKDLKENFIKIRNETDEIIDLLTEDWFNEENFIKAFAEIKPYHLANDILVGILLNGMWLMNNEEFYKHYSLEDMDIIYTKLTDCKNNVSLELIENYASFLYSTMAENPKAKKLGEEGLSRAKAYIEEFENIIKAIDEEDS